MKDNIDYKIDELNEKILNLTNKIDLIDIENNKSKNYSYIEIICLLSPLIVLIITLNL